MTDLKALKKLADACRKAGIKHYKDTNMEFTLTDEAPLTNYKRRHDEFITKSTPNTDVINEDNITQDQLLFYSVTDISEGNT